MQLNEHFFGSEKMMSEVSTEILRIFRGAGMQWGASKTPKVCESSGAPFTSYCMLRYGVSDDYGFLALGYSTKQAQELLERYKLLNSLENESNNKSLKMALVKGIYEIVDKECKTNSQPMNASNFTAVAGKDLGFWKSFNTKKIVQFGFDTPHGELTLEVPECPQLWHQTKMAQTFGFPQNTKILVVDDSATSRKLTTNYMNMSGFFNVESQPDGAAAFKSIQNSTEPFGLVIADWHMPEMSGIDLLRSIRKNPPTAQLPVILATGEKKKEEIMSAITEGVNGYLIKPLDSESFYATVQKVGFKVHEASLKAA